MAKDLDEIGESTELPEGVLARIDLTQQGIAVNLKEGMHKNEFATMLRLLADAFEYDTIQRVDGD